MATLAIDFDGVISHYTGWRGINAPLDPPVSGALIALREYIDGGFDVVVHTSRADSAEQTKRIFNWFLEHGLERRYLDQMAITATKPPALIYLDDRAWCFTGDFPTVPEIKAFKTWQNM